MDFVSQLEALGVVALAGILGGVVGFEREMARKPAGLRTHIFVAASAALLVVLGEAMLNSYQSREGTQAIEADPIRVVQAIIVGISFLGAGTIFRHPKSDVQGLTTAASVLLTAGIGIAVGAHQFVLAAGVTVMAVVVLHGLNGLARRAEKASNAETKLRSDTASSDGD